MNELIELLAGGDRRSIGRSEEVLAAVLADETLFQELFLGLDSRDPVVRMRARRMHWKRSPLADRSCSSLIKPS